MTDIHEFILHAEPLTQMNGRSDAPQAGCKIANTGKQLMRIHVNKDLNAILCPIDYAAGGIDAILPRASPDQALDSIIGIIYLTGIDWSGLRMEGSPNILKYSRTVARITANWWNEASESRRTRLGR